MTRYCVAYEPDDWVMKNLFNVEPTAQWIVTPTRIIARAEFFAVKASSTGTNATPRPVNPS
jgi:hypothetical protein